MAAMVPNECHRIGARSGNCSLRFDRSIKALSRCFGFVNSKTSGYRTACASCPLMFYNNKKTKTGIQ